MKVNNFLKGLLLSLCWMQCCTNNVARAVAHAVFVWLITYFSQNLTFQQKSAPDLFNWETVEMDVWQCFADQVTKRWVGNLKDRPMERIKTQNWPFGWKGDRLGFWKPGRKLAWEAELAATIQPLQHLQNLIKLKAAKIAL